MRRLTFKHALTPNGIVSGVRVTVDDTGSIVTVEPGSGPYDGDFAIPGMPNAHSHAFQRGLTGLGEARAGEDSFWSWREAMYALANGLTPERMYMLAHRAYSEMLKAGFTSVAEFHYVHHLADGTRGTQMADAVVRAAHEAGIRLRLLPVYYRRGGFDRPASAVQSRFVHESVDEYLALVDAIDHPHKGYAPHSLRAVPIENIQEISRRGSVDRVPVHIHISEQRAEVDQCLAVHGQRPIELLAASANLDARWTLVHATHADTGEIATLTASGATVALCPLTEAYLGDGLFAAVDFQAAGGRIAIGSDSNVRIDAIEELRWLEYGQRLRDERRARLADADGIGRVLWTQAAEGGAQATDFPVGRIAPGHYADLVVLSEEGAPWRGLPVDRWLDAWLVGGSRADIAAVYVGGERR